MANYISSDKKVDIKDIIMEHIKAILTISRREFRSSYTTVIEKDGIRQDIVVPDTRKEYYQSVESLCDVVSPNYDEETTKFENSILMDLNNLLKSEGEETEDYIVGKFKLMRKMFRQLNKLLYSKSYLGGFDGYKDDDEDDD
jgi:hypothetical protein